MKTQVAFSEVKEICDTGGRMHLGWGGGRLREKIGGPCQEVGTSSHKG